MFKVNYPSKIFESKGFKKVQKQVREIIETPGSMMAVIGEIGSGKTVAVFEAAGEFEERGHYIIWIRQPDRERMKAGTIMSAMVRILGEEPKRDSEARTEQLRRLLGEKSALKRISLIIDDAHPLSREVLRSLKRLLELGFGKRIGLFSIILVGTQELYPKLMSVPEIYWRTYKLDMKLLTQEEAQNFSLWVADWEQIKIESAAADYLSQKFNNPLVLASTITMLKDQALKIGEIKITHELVKSLLLADVKDQMATYHISQKQIANAINESEAVISKTLANQYTGSDKLEKIKAGLAHLVKDKSTVKVQ
jgi:hypothetical protein